VSRPRPIPCALLLVLLATPAARAGDVDAGAWKQKLHRAVVAFAEPGDLAAKRARLDGLLATGREGAWLFLLAAVDREGRHLETLARVRRAAWAQSWKLWRRPRSEHDGWLVGQLGRRFELLAAADYGWFHETMFLGSVEARMTSAPPDVQDAYVQAATQPAPDLGPAAREAVAALAARRLRGPGDVTALRALLERDPDVRVRLAALRALPERGAEVGALLLRRLRDRSWVVRVAAAHALGRRHVADAAAGLADALRRAGPREAYALQRALAAVGAEVPDAPEGPAVFGRPLASRRVLFLVDTSAGSAQSLPRVRRELARVLPVLPRGTRFGLLAYDGALHPWRDGLVAAGPDTSKAALAWLASLEPDWNACLGGALREAFRLAGLAPEEATPDEGRVDTVVVLTTSMPTLYAHGKARPQDPGELLRLTRIWNRDRRVRLVVVPLAEGPVASFAQRLERANGDDDAMR
jgi:hypothetical protein